MLSKNAEKIKQERFNKFCEDKMHHEGYLWFWHNGFDEGYQVAQDEAKAEIESIKAELNLAKVQIAVLNHVRDTLTRAMDKAVEALQKDDEVES